MEGRVMSKMKYGKTKYAYYGPDVKTLPSQLFKVKPASDKQKQYLTKLGISFSEGISSQQASKLISAAVNEARRKSIAFFVGKHIK